MIVPYDMKKFGLWILERLHVRIAPSLTRSRDSY
jgi:hypothetical protein